ncbi:hypothetical protein T05_10465 [Trichinella murrelli]|uniref:Uncharacterized protein n=1 Tax=Trichinella murrelli TaxID=144512 RepID=A0A0V0UFH9_9BILA|nr:hypothetical protein T05_10465 [Trichinella murrelli]
MPRCNLLSVKTDVQDDTAQYLERAWFDYCSVHVSTVISHSALWFSSSSKIPVALANMVCHLYPNAY